MNIAKGKTSRIILFASFVVVSILSNNISKSQPTLKMPFSESHEQRAKSIEDSILPGNEKSYEVVTDPSKALSFKCLCVEGNIKFNLISPNGIRIDSTSAKDNKFCHYSSQEALSGVIVKRYVIFEPTYGIWTLEVTADSNANNVISYSIRTILHDPEVIFVVETDRELYRSGDSVKLKAIIKRNSSPILDASVMANILLPDGSTKAIKLYDDGTHGDLISKDGQYMNIFTGLSLAGHYSILFTASQTNMTTFSRESSIVINVLSGESRFDELFRDTGLDTDGDNLFNELIIEIGLKVIDNGEYRITGSLYDTNNTLIDNFSVDTVLQSGNHILSLYFDGFKIYENGIDGPYILNRLILFGKDNQGSYLKDLIEDAQITSNYRHREFQRPAIYFIGNFKDYGLDIDSDGLYDSLLVTFEVDLVGRDHYQWQAQLNDIDGKTITYASHKGLLNPGISTISLSFDGATIRNNEKNGPFTINGIVIYSKAIYPGVSPCDNYKTNYYKYTEFGNLQ